MELKWRILYGFVVLLGNNLCCLGRSVGREKRCLEETCDYNKNGSASKQNTENNLSIAENKKLKDDIMKLILKRSSDESVTRLLLKALEDDAAYRAYTKRDHPITVLYHKTLKKIEGGPLSDENAMLRDNRIRVAPMGLESLDQPDMSLALAKLVDLNSLIENAAIKASNTDHSSVKQLKRFLYNNALKPSRKSVKFKINRNKDKFNNLAKDNKEESPRNKREIMKMLLAAYPMQFGLSEGGLLQHYLGKNSDAKFRPNQFITGVSKDPSFSPSNEVADQIAYNAAKQNRNYGNNEPHFEYNKNFTRLLNNLSSEDKFLNRPDEVSLKKAVLSEDELDKIHQSAEDTVFKHVLNELISDIPNYVGLSTNKPLKSNFDDELFNEPNEMQKIESKVKSAKHAQENLAPTTCKDSYPCMKIRVKNGPVILTFQADAPGSSTTKPTSDISNLPVFPLFNNKLTSSDRNMNAIASEPLLKNSLAKLTDDPGFGEPNKDQVDKSNISRYFSGSDIDADKSSYFDENSFAIQNNSKNLKDATLTRLSQLVKNSPVALQNQMFDEPNYFTQMKNSTSKKQVLIGTNSTSPSGGSNSRETAEGLSFDVRNCVSNDRFPPRKSVSVACPVRTDSFILPDIKVQRFGVPRNLFLTRTGSDHYKLTHSPYYYRFGTNCSHCGGDSYWRYVPKVYYNDLVVSKGLVGQHPSREECSGAMLSDRTLKKMEMLNILKFYLDSLTPERNYSSNRSKDHSNFIPMLNHNRKYFIKM